MIESSLDLDLRLTSPDFIDDPYPVYKALRESEPVHWSNEWGVWVLTRYDDTDAILRDPQRYSNVGRFNALLDQLPPEVQPDVVPLRRHYSGGLIQSDPPDHTRLRTLVRQAFTPRVIEGYRERVQVIVDTLIEPFLDTGRVDIVMDVAYPLPVFVVSEILGAPTSDLSQVFRWTSDIGGLQATGGAREDKARRAAASIQEIEDYFRQIIVARRAKPGADLISSLIAAQDAGDRLNDAELISMCVTLLLAGHETTKNLVSNGILTLLRHPDQLAALRDEPSLLPTAVEEVLRFESPIQRGWRIVAVDTELRGHQLSAGQLVYYMFGSANRDPEQFPDPDRFDVRRRDNRHLAFGYGIHFCIGAPLARLEGSIAIGTILRKLPGLELREDRIEWGQSVHVRCPRHLVVGFSG
jgi:cytochrome P450